MRKQNAQSNYENEKLSLAQRNPRRVGEAASSACALRFFPHGNRWKVFGVFVARGEEPYLFVWSVRRPGFQGIKTRYIFLSGV